MRKLIGFITFASFVAFASLVGCSTGPDGSGGSCSVGCEDSGAVDTGANVCTEVPAAAVCTAALEGTTTTMCATSHPTSWVCCGSAWKQGTSCGTSPAPDSGTTCAVSAGQSCPSYALQACSASLTCCTNTSGSLVWVAGSSCGSGPVTDSGTTPTPDTGTTPSGVDPLPAGGSGDAANVSITVSAPAVGGVKPDHVYVEGGYVNHQDMRRDTLAQWLPGSSWVAFGATFGCDTVNGTGFVCTVPKPAGYDLRYQVYVQRGSSVYYVCNVTPATLDPGGSTQVASGIPTSKVVFPINVKGAPYVNCQYGS